MSSPLLPAALVGLLAGGGAATAVTLALSPEPAPVAELAFGDESELDLRVDTLIAQNKELTERLARLEADALMATPSVARTASTSAEDLAAMKADLQAMLDGIKSPAGLPPQQFEAMVAAANENIDARKREERLAERSQREAEALETKLADLATELGLDQGQVGRMRETLTAQSQKRTALFEEMRNGDFAGGRDEIRNSMRELRDETNTVLQTFLTPTQFDQYSESEGGRDGGRGRGGRGGRDGF